MNDLRKCLQELSLIHPTRLEMLIYDVERDYITVDRTEREILLDCLKFAMTFKRCIELLQRKDSELTKEDIKTAKVFIRTLSRKLFDIDEDLSRVEHGKEN